MFNYYEMIINFKLLLLNPTIPIKASYKNIFDVEHSIICRCRKMSVIQSVIIADIGVVILVVSKMFSDR